MAIVLISCGLLLFSAIGVGAAIFFFQRYSNPEPSVVQARLIRLKERHDEETEEVRKQLQLRMGKLYRDTGYANAQLAEKLEKLSLFNSVRVLLIQASIKTPADKYFMNFMVFPVIIGGILGVVAQMPIILLGSLLIPVLSYFALVFKKKQRLDKFLHQLPDALSMITSGLRAGHSFQSALTLVSTQMAEPIGAEFTSMVRDINLGVPVNEAMDKLVLRLDGLPDVHMFATAVIIQREAGGNLAEVLEKLGYTVRERFKLKGQISALTGQSRLTGYVLGAAPAVLLLGLSLVMYSYVAPLYETPFGNIALVVSGVMQLIGFVIMRKIVDIRV